MSSFTKAKNSLRLPIFFKLVASLKSLKKRNLLRGYASQELRIKSAIDDIRKGNTIDDIMTIGALLKGPKGLIAGETKKTSSDLFRFTMLTALHWQEEVRYTCGYLNSAQDDCTAALKHMAQLAKLEKINGSSHLRV